MAKRVSDAVIAAVLFVVTLPLLVAAAIGLSITLRAWPFFAHDRVGMNGEIFQMPKLRTLPTTAPKYTDKRSLRTITLPRLALRVRQLHIDELPQLLLVITGKMSLVGPRPEMPYLHEQTDSSVTDQRTLVRPGCTGLWQISTKASGMIHDSPEFDEFYVRHHNLRLDLWILRRTVIQILGFLPPVDLDDLHRLGFDQSLSTTVALCPSKVSINPSTKHSA